MTFYPVVDLQACTMAATPRKCKGKEDRTCSYFPSSIAKDYHEQCTVCRDQICIVDLRSDHCKEWSVDKWSNSADPYGLG